MNTDEQLSLLNHPKGIPPLIGKFRQANRYPLTAISIDILQISVGRVCNLACRHCHVDAGPKRTEIMSRKVLDKCLEVLEHYPISTIDITGGAPEMNPHLEEFVRQVAKLKKRLIVRSNLTLLLEAPYRRFLDLFQENQVEIVASLPDYLEIKSDRQRGQGVFQRVIETMRELNVRGYGMEGSGLVLDIVHNPVGAYLPGSQTALEREYRRRLLAEHSVHFNQLFCITNIPVGRYLEYLLASDNLDDYFELLCQAFNPMAVDRVMCRTTLSVSWDGSLYDCDFNQMLDLKVSPEAPDNIMNFDWERLKSRRIVLHNHCYGCVAGSGSSCQGATTEG